MQNPYDTLGVDRSADAGTIKKAYRRKAQKHHPDKGGDTKIFYAIRKAFEVLGDEARRAKYDETGDESEVPGIEQEINDAAVSLFLSLLDKVDVERTDLMEQMNYHLLLHESTLESRSKAVIKKIVRLEKVKARMTCKGGTDILGGALETTIKQTKRERDGLAHALEVADGVRTLIKQYEYQVTRGQPADALSQFLT